MIVALAAALATQSVADIRDHRRVLIVAAPADGDAQRVRQASALRDGAAALDDRDVTLVEVTGDHVRGASDDAMSLRRRFDLPAARFAVVLIGKDGHVALRRTEPIALTTLVAGIDAMPMRRAGQR